MKIKVCGIKEKTHALGAVAAGVDFIGLVLAQSPRQISAAQAREIVEVIKDQPGRCEVVGVFVNMPVPAVNRIARDCGLDWVQLSGDETWAYCQQIEMPVIKAAHAYPEQDPAELAAYFTSGDIALAGKKYLYLLDSRTPQAYGGTGLTCDWSAAAEVARHFPVILAGGLGPENVAEAIRVVAPWGVDVSSGVEVNGIKSIARIKAFIEAVRSADDSK
jgi:phosphoribosylanthranilate isomerase